MNYSEEFLQDVSEAIDSLHVNEIELMVDIVAGICHTGRLFIIGSGGGAGHASHAVCDFRKLCDCDAITFENLSELTARTNDEGWETTTVEWLKVSKFNKLDGLLIISVGGGQPGVSMNLVNALDYAHGVGSKIVGITGKPVSFTSKYADACVVIKSNNITPVTEGLQSVIWHLLVSHPKLNKKATKW